MATRTILAADDDADFLKLAGQVLTHAGYTVIYARDAYQALQFALNRKPDLLLLDVHMPAGEGLSVQERLSNTPALKNIPVIYLTGERSERVQHAAHDLGAYAVLYKPFEFPHLLTTIHDALEKSELRTAPADGVLQFSAPSGAISPFAMDPVLHVAVR